MAPKRVSLVIVTKQYFKVAQIYVFGPSFGQNSSMTGGWLTNQSLSDGILNLNSLKIFTMLACEQYARGPS